MNQNDTKPNSEDKVNILYYNDHKGKWQSVELSLDLSNGSGDSSFEIPYTDNSFFNANIESYGANLPDALSNMIDALHHLKKAVDRCVKVLENPSTDTINIIRKHTTTSVEKVDTFSRVDYWDGVIETRSLEQELEIYNKELKKKG